MNKMKIEKQEIKDIINDIINDIILNDEIKIDETQLDSWIDFLYEMFNEIETETEIRLQQTTTDNNKIIQKTTLTNEEIDFLIEREMERYYENKYGYEE
jgi:hypothetical protein